MHAPGRKRMAWNALSRCNVGLRIRLSAMAKKPEYLYHYTTAEKLINIVKLHELWATDVFYMNDRSEFRLGLELAKKWLWTDDATKRYGEEARKTARGLQALSPGAIGFRMFVCCFSEDGNALAQWRAYCPRGGYALGLPFDGLNIPSSDSAVWLRKCIYKREEQRMIVRKHVDESNATLNDLVTALINESIRFKHDAFDHEKEWRLVHWTSGTGNRDRAFTKYDFSGH
jgi:hypothetical protein